MTLSAKDKLALIHPKPLDSYSEEEWEALCDGCGLCCQIRLEDIDTGEVVLSNAACRLLDCKTCRCTDYEHRLERVPDCTKITPETIDALDWLPFTCAYRTVARGDSLAKWHYLVCGDTERVHNHGPSMRGNLISEDDADFNV
jgi:uncharacterized cysteine cluster protein YcgN (CxxCxxCC family)